MKVEVESESESEYLYVFTDLITFRSEGSIITLPTTTTCSSMSIQRVCVSWCTPRGTKWKKIDKEIKNLISHNVSKFLLTYQIVSSAPPRVNLYINLDSWWGFLFFFYFFRQINHLCLKQKDNSEKGIRDLPSEVLLHYTFQTPTRRPWRSDFAAASYNHNGGAGVTDKRGVKVRGGAPSPPPPPRPFPQSLNLHDDLLTKENICKYDTCIVCPAVCSSFLPVTRSIREVWER